MMNSSPSTPTSFTAVVSSAGPGVLPTGRDSGWSRRQWIQGLAGMTAIAGTGAWLSGCASRPGAPSSGGKGVYGAVPGTVIAHSPAPSGRFVGSPSIAVLPNGEYVASHDFFGPKSNEHQRATGRVYRSADRGQHWQLIAEIDGMFWSSLFVHRGALYLLGLDRHHGRILIRRSRDGGATWTTPVDGRSGVLRADAEFHCAAMPVVEHAGRLWRAFEWRNPPTSWGVNYRAGVLSVPVDGDLLDAAQWTSSEFLASDRAWNRGDMGGWLEGNVVAGPDNTLWNLLRVDTREVPEKGALLRISNDGRTVAFDPETGFVDLPGGAKKFAVRRGPKSGAYWSLVSFIAPGWEHLGKPATVRNTLSLVRSVDLRHWEVRCHLLHHPDRVRHGFQYVDWLFDGADLIAACRTAYDDDTGGANNAHDANYLTFHRIRNFRSLSPRDSVPLTRPVPSGA